VTKYDPDSLVDRGALGRRLVARLEACGFTDAMPARGELVFTRKDKREPRLCVAVYTSCTLDADEQPVARPRGADAIRVLARFEDNRTGVRRGVVKPVRVFRTGRPEDIEQRMYEAMRSVWAEMTNRRAWAVRKFSSTGREEETMAIKFSLSTLGRYGDWIRSRGGFASAKDADQFESACWQAEHRCAPDYDGRCVMERMTAALDEGFRP